MTARPGGRSRWLAFLLAIVLIAGSCSADTSIPDDANAGPGASADVAEQGDDPGPDSNQTDADTDADTGTDGVAEDSSEQAQPGDGDVDGTGEPTTDQAPRERWIYDIAEAEPKPEEWAEVSSPDPRAEEYLLDNGIRVIVRANHAPGGQAQLRLVIDAGSLEEEPPYLGVAHFLEHMMFNGTERFPGNELIPVLESFGSAFGADINAYTSYSETVYTLTVPASTHDGVELGLEVLSEWATNATIDPDEVIAERGVVREEMRRSVESVGGRLGEQVRDVLLDGTVHQGRDPIGTLEAVESMHERELRAFYETWYRPDLMTVIVVGDVNIAATKSSIEQAFGSIPAVTNGPEPIVDDPEPGLVEPVYDVITDPEMSQTSIEILWRAKGAMVDSRQALHGTLVKTLATSVIDARLFEAGEQGESVAVAASASSGAITDQLEIVGLEARVDPGDVVDMLKEFALHLEQLRQHGPSVAELTRARDQIRAGVEQQFSESERVQDFELASGYVAYALGQSIVVDPELERDQTLEVLESITARDLRAHIDSILSSSPYVLVTAPASAADELPEPEELAATLDDAIGWRVPAPGHVEAGPDSLMEAPAPATETQREQLQGLNATAVTYENGVQVAVKQTTIADNYVQFQAWSRGGFFHEEGDVVPLLGMASSLVMPSGFATIDTVALDRILGSSVVSLSGEVGRAIETLNGEASIDDLETLFQLIHLQMTEPTISDVSVRRFDENWRPLAENPGVNPGLAADLVLWNLRYGDSPYFRYIPTVADLDALDSDAQLDAWRRRFFNAADFEFVFVGDVEPNVVFDLAAKYLATLPTSEDREGQVDRDPGIPPENLVETVASGIGDQGRLRINWESPYPFTLEAEIAARALEVVVDARLRDLVREELGASYAPHAAVSVLYEPKSWVDTIIEVDGDPDRLDEVSQVVHAELARIRAGELDPGYLERAVDQMAEGFRFFSNDDWIELITFHLANPERSPTEYRDRTAVARALTIADLAETAQLVFPEGHSVEVRLVPADN